jgi:aspartokinase-like uncharacterized kinase
VIETVVKLGGAVLAAEPLAALSGIPRNGSTLIVPGGGPFADTVRAVDARLGLGDDAAHWAAILAMDQYAYALAALVHGATLVHEPRDLPLADDTANLPVLAPYQWLRATDPLPHSWDVTSDSIAAWVAGAVGAERLLLLKPVSDGGVDKYFECVRAGLDVRVLAVDTIDTIQTVLAEPAAWAHLSSP